MDDQPSRISNLNRASWRSQCRNRLAQHIWEKLGLRLKPSEVRLKSTEELQYAWEIDDPELEPLFDKHLSKHSAGVYMQLCREVGQSFHAVRCNNIDQRPPPAPLSVQYEQVMAEKFQLIQKLEQVEKDKAALELAKAEAEDEIQVQKSIIREAQMTIHLHQQDIQHWMTVAEYYQSSCMQCSEALGQLIAFAQGISTELPSQLTQ
ncbi:uncharacterized protein ATNIH1004_002326 [Aspergillus tanneri]|uniref:Uncharacterized protein n=1 Tax=Aspergillus tanneri TaxID=1220188 RepID=A0A5M9MRH5_9EURO|nr:uncharacterized protein ATNIH1004_006602 [Aspergillus tanneri]XP_033429016.1 uncharacterized protein ATNIH1004_002326 [Aspergillus tanneri]KAA8647900.1 hypothetical protein ATNIH1004_006602 [Aspergillus tanneri]KAA8649655.1 hypothetical protein ATNIH1004_002326 [Aspergillus tanneri]